MYVYIKVIHYTLLHKLFLNNKYGKHEKEKFKLMQLSKERRKCKLNA